MENHLVFKIVPSWSFNRYYLHLFCSRLPLKVRAMIFWVNISFNIKLFNTKINHSHYLLPSQFNLLLNPYQHIINSVDKYSNQTILIPCALGGHIWNMISQKQTYQNKNDNIGIYIKCKFCFENKVEGQ